MSNPIISSPSSFANMSRAQLDLVAQAATTSGFDPYDILYGPPSNTRSPSLGPRTSTPAGSGLSQGSFSPSDISIPPTPSPTLRRRGHQPTSLLNLAREQVRARGINPMEFMARPLREAGRRGGVGPIVVPPFTPSPSPLPSSIDFSQAKSTISSRGRRRQRRQQRQRPACSSAPAGLGRGRGRRAEVAEVMMMMTIRISVLTVVTEGDRDSKSCYENFRGCNKITWKGVAGDKLPGSLIQIQLPPHIKTVVHPQ